MEIVLGIIVIGIIAFLVISGNAKNRAQQEAAAAAEALQRQIDYSKRKYDEALAELRRDPSHRQAALDAGRKYMADARGIGGTTVYDETALMNDIGAAAAEGERAQRAAAPVAVAAPATSPADRLRKLDELRGQGLITDEEYQARRAKILDEM